MRLESSKSLPEFFVPSVQPGASASPDVTRVLLLEDSPDDAWLIQQIFSECPGNFKVTQVERLSWALEHIVRNEVDVVLCDLSLPDASGLEAPLSLRSAAPSVPLIVMTRNNDEEIAAEALRHGAQDYLVKGDISNHSILRSVRYAIRRQQTQVDTERIRAQQVQLKEEFLSNVSHELRSPLAAMHQFARILEDEIPGALNGEQMQYVGIILKNGRQLESMIDDLLEVTRIQAGKLTVEQQCISLQEAVSDTIRNFLPAAKARGILLCAELGDELPLAYADPIRVRQVLENLVTNAIKFTPKGGAVWVRVAMNQQDPTSLTLEVSDTGCGIAPESIEKIFERLYQEPDHDREARKGLGLGLYISRELVVRQGGKIRVESIRGKGSTFFFTVPVWSIYALIDPLIMNQKLRPQSLAVVSVKIFLPGARRPSEDVCRKARRTLERCMLPDLDVLLPRIHSAGPEEVYFAVALAREEGVQVLMRRIQDQLNLLEEIKCGAVKAVVVRTMLDHDEIAQCTSSESLARWVAVQVGGLVNSAAFARSYSNDEKNHDN
jgi:signal transduction histidine kinase